MIERMEGNTNITHIFIYLGLVQPTKWEEDVFESTWLDHGKEVTLIFGRVDAPVKCHSIVTINSPFQLCVVASCHFIDPEAVPDVFEKSFKLDVSVAPYVGVGCRSRLIKFDSLFEHICPVLPHKIDFVKLDFKLLSNLLRVIAVLLSLSTTAKCGSAFV